VFRSSGGDGEVEEAWGEVGGCRGLGLVPGRVRLAAVSGVYGNIV
jgi:hypothetical protein